MHRPPPERLIFMANADLRVMVIRPVGYLQPGEVMDSLFEQMAQLDQPWQYNRLIDVRRYENEFSAQDMDVLARRWRQVRGVNRSFAHVAIVKPNHCHRRHEAGPLLGFPDETICRFTSYADAFNWLTAADRHAFLSAIAGSGPKQTTVTPRRRAQPLPDIAIG
ncbi:hypothetical protein [Asticcacaulis sp. AND118]|uniref:hypothetical protein n=1 Tax=Asticcacaulis sp. AND118 TaxID=2840468 RepID=UPI001CFF8250|nr:hypothetical protein [Asticcacaulis sp. AND118]UDF03063.1 hypothetical protein LH365_11565 [Asticcacaulis sp. AND118]